MKLLSEDDVRQTEEKITLLEEHYERIKRGETELNPVAQHLSLTSLRRTINQMKEDVVRYRSAVERQRS